MWSVVVVAATTLVVWLARCGSAFNVLPKSAVVYAPPVAMATPRDHFGYSVAMVRAARKMWMVVSAPGAQSALEDPRYTRPGAIFSCDTDSPVCEQIRLVQGEVQGGSKVDPLVVSNGSLGSAMDALPNDEGLLVCNHAYKNLYNANKRLDMPGKCYWMDDVRSNKPLKWPIPNNKEGQKSKVVVNNQLYEDDIGTQMMGFSGHEIQSRGDIIEMILGSPGYFWGRGAVVQMNISSTGRTEDRVLWGVAIPLLRNDSYFGYSVTSGKFLPNGGIAYAAGAPRGDSDDLKGRVVVFTMNQNNYDENFHQINILAVLNGSQIGEYFGAAICSLDLNRDGVDDLLVGAPLHKSSRNSPGDEGKVYVFLSSGKSHVTFTLVEPGLEPGGNKTTGARFGTAISALGDVNKDGYPDVAVGAPYEEDQGAVYVYYGGPTAPYLLRPQRIFAEDVRKTLRGFGYSLSRAANDDVYNGTVVAVGAYLSNEAVLLRSSPVLILNSTVKVNPSFGGKIPMYASNVTIEVCVLRGELLRDVGVEVTVTLDPDLGRATFSGGAKVAKYIQDMSKDGRRENCKSFDLDIKTKNKNFKPLGIQLSFEIVYPRQDPGLSFCKMCPVLDPLNKNHQHQLYFATGCEGHVCKTNFEVKAGFDHTETSLTIGTKPTVEMIVYVVNHGESSYETNITITFPSAVHLKMVPSTCRKDPTKETEIATLQCEPPYFMNQNKVFDLRLTFEMDNIPWSLDRLMVNVSVEGDGEEVTPADNHLALSLDLRHTALVYMKGRSSPESLEIVVKRNDSDDVIYQDKVFEHTYTVINEGPSPIHDLQVKFEFPYKMKTGATEITYLNIEPKKPFDVTSIVNDEVVSRRKPTHENYEDSSYLMLDCSNPKIECLTETFVYSKSLNKDSGVTFSFKITGLFKEHGSLLNKGVVLVRTNGYIMNEELLNQELDVPNKPLNSAIETLLHGRIPKGEVKSWIIVVAVICGILILIGLIIILWKYGFFRRNKPPTSDELEANGKPPTGEKVDTDPLCDGTP